MKNLRIKNLWFELIQDDLDYLLEDREDNDIEDEDIEDEGYEDGIFVCQECGSPVEDGEQCQTCGLIIEVL